MKEKKQTVDLYAYDNALRGSCGGSFCGVDEAGRGPLCGPVFAAAVVLPEDIIIEGINDSKKLSEKKREILYDKIKESAIDWCVASASAREIDELNILNATYLAMNRAISGLKNIPGLCLIDGNRCEGIKYPAQCLISGDATSASIAAASILAKVSRDRYMLKYAEKYPQYGFEQHKGYGTALHYEMIRTYGVTPEHRKTFLKKMH